jgi:hypothetical protein
MYYNTQGSLSFSFREKCVITKNVSEVSFTFILISVKEGQSYRIFTFKNVL